MKDYSQIAHREDWRRASERNVEGMPQGMKGVGDVVPAAFGIATDRAEDPRNALSSAQLQWDVAIRHFRKRRVSEGFGPERVARDVANAKEACSKVRALCESPIEHQIAPWLVCQNYGQWPCTSPVAHIPKIDIEPPRDDLLIIPQFAFARFRMDFAIVAKYRGHLRIVAVECDGSGYHDVRRDLRRDAYLMGWNIPTVRATGSEIALNPKVVAERVARHVLDWACELGLEP